MRECPLMVGLGEVLWDILPSGKVLGGAPTNFAYMSSVLGNRGVIASRIGKDELGRETCEAVGSLGVSTSYVQFDAQHETGTAKVQIDSKGQPNFTITAPVAWDYLEWTPEWQELASRADVVCFGSLAQRSPVSAETIEQFLQSTSPIALRICDANLREPFYTPETIRRSFNHADILKLNDQELACVASIFSIKGDNEAAIAKELFRKFHLQLLCLTRGANGSLLVSEDEVVEHPGYSVEVADAVGAGDAFTACVAHYYMQGRPLTQISESANRFASWVATQIGATPLVQRSTLQDLLGEPASR